MEDLVIDGKAVASRYRSALAARRTVRALPHDLDFDRAFAHVRDHIGITQQQEEVGRLWELVRALRPRRVLEIGVDEGGTLFLWTRAASPDARLIAVDTRPPGKLGPLSPYQIVRRGFACEEQRISLLLGRDSHSPETFDDVRNLLAGEALDFLFIDGDHSYGGVKRDFELYSTLVRVGGIIAMHDVWPARRQNEEDAPNDGSVRFWRELEDGRDTEVAAVRSPDGYGIGILRV